MILLSSITAHADHSPWHRHSGAAAAPIRLAEDTATLDLVSNGRLDIGFGRGSANYEYGGYNISREESQGRFQESIRIVEKLWTTPDYTA